MKAMSDGWFIATSISGADATGEAISSSDMQRVQLAVPPRIAAP